MKTTIIAAVAAATLAAAYGLPGDVLVLSDNDVRPDEAAGLYYLGSCAAGYLYNGSSAAVGAAAPYRLLDEGARGKHYFLVSLPKRTALTEADLEAVGEVQRLDDDYLLAVARPGGVGALLAMEPRLRLRELRPTARVDWRVDAETPPARKNATVEAAVNTITAEEYAGYIRQLQSYGTRYSFTPGCETARNWLRNWFAGQNLDADWHAFECGRYELAHYPRVGENLYLDDYHCMVRRSQDDGASWDTLRPKRGAAGWYYNPPSCCWLDGDTGVVAGVDGYVALTADGGDSWQFVQYYSISPAGGFINIRGLDFASSRVGWLSFTAYERTGNEGPLVGHSYVLRTEDGGRSWNEVEWNMLFPGFDRLATYDEKRMWALRYYVAFGAYLYYSGDGGGNWAACSLPVGSGEYVYDAAAVGPREGLGRYCPRPRPPHNERRGLA